MLRTPLNQNKTKIMIFFYNITKNNTFLFLFLILDHHFINYNTIYTKIIIQLKHIYVYKLKY
jgi:hypothetical protein